METLTVRPVLLMLMLGLTLTTGFHVAYKLNAGAAGIAKIAPWLSRRSAAAVRSARGWFASALAFVWRRPELAIATVVLLAMLVHPAAVAGVGIMGVTGTINVSQLERDLLKKSSEAATLLENTAKACQAHEEKDKDGKVIATGRLMIDDEKKAIQALIDDGNKIKAQIERAKGDSAFASEIERMTAGVMKGGLQPTDPAAVRKIGKTLGQQWVESDAYKFAQEKAKHRATNWTSPLSAEMFAATLSEDAASGGDLIVTEDRPGILPLLFKRLVIADLLAKGTTDANSVTYMKETTFTNAAAAVAEGQPKPESTLVFDQVTDLVVKIAHWLPVTDEMLEDVSQIRSYIDARLRLGLDISEEDQLLNGNGTAPNMTGLLNRSGLTTAEVRSGSVTNAEAIFTEMMKVFNAAFVMPTGHVLNPANWQTIQLSKDGEGRYYGSGPFAGPQAPTLWGLPVVVTPSIVANTALTGAFNSAAQVFRKGGVRVEASNSHSDFFVRNLTAIRAEERLALAVYRPAAFGKITSLT